MNNEEVRPTGNLVISKCTAYEYLDNSNPNIEKLTTQYYKTFSITSRFTGYFSNITIGDFYNDLSAKYNSPTATLGGLNLTARDKTSENSTKSEQSETNNNNNGNSNSDVITNPEDLIAGTSSISGKRGTENFGIAVFKEDKYQGELTAVESMCHLLIQNKVDSCIISIDNPISDNDKIELQLFPQHNSKIKVTIENDTPHIAINLDLHADIITLNKNVDYETDVVLSKISNSSKEYLTKEFNDYLNKISSEYETDIDNFCAKAKANFLTISDWEDFNWNEKFKNTKFDININIDVLSAMLITKT